MNDIAEVPSVIGRLLSELSWSGTTIRRYREGGRGFENVLTAEALQALDFLPRTHFFGAVLQGAAGAGAARMATLQEVESLEFTLLPGNFYLRPNETSHQTMLAVQPDGLLCSSRAYVVLEAKRLRRCVFQEEQLAREYMLALQQCGNATPLLFLLLPEYPPVPIRGKGRMAPEAAIAAHLPNVFSSTDQPRYSLDEMLERIPQVLCWSTWDDVSNTLLAQLDTLAITDPSLKASMRRLVDTVSNAIAWHR